MHLRIGYISPTDPFVDKRAWSGTYFNIRKAIEDAGFEVEWIPSEASGALHGFWMTVCKVLHRILVGNGKFGNSKMSMRIRSRYVNRQKLDKFDLIFAPGQSDVVAGINTSVPIVRYSDCTAGLMVDYYWVGWSKKALSEADYIEREAIRKASINLLSSKWAADSVINDYGAAKENVFVIPFGANIDDDRVVKASPFEGGRLNLLFSGVDWERKGGQIAVDAAKKLVAEGYDVRLFICGISDLDPNVSNLDFVENLGFLSKNVPKEYQKYLDVWSKTHLLILPTRAECSAIVYNEALAYGVPVITTDTGGGADYVINDVTGYRMKLDDGGDAYAAKIAEWIEGRRFELLSQEAVKLYNGSNSWKAWSKRFRTIVDDLQ